MGLRKKFNLHQEDCRGFTLMELLVVVGVLGIMATAVLIRVNPIAQYQKGRDTRRIGDAREIVSVLQQFYTDKSRYPGSSGSPLCTSSWCNSSNGASWIPEMSTYSNNLPQDPKNSSPLLYYYKTDGTDYCLEVRTERDAASNRNYFGYDSSNQIWKLHFGPNAPSGGLCASSGS